jgi:3-oxoacyl-[acyl-carrier-protein] synthase III
MESGQRGLFISQIEFFLPEISIDNKDLESRFGTNADLIERKTGVAIRFHVKNQLMTHMAEEAAKKIFYRTPELKKEIDAVILVGHGFEYQAPVSAALLQHRLGLKNECMALDLPQGCTGYVNALALCRGLLESNISKKILLLTGDTPSFAIEKNDEDLLSIFSDSGSASVVELKESPSNQFIQGTDGSGAELLCVKRSGTLNRADAKWINDTGMLHGKMEMDGTAIFTFALKTVPKMVEEVIRKNNLQASEIDYYFFHQANSMLLEALRKKMKIPTEKFFNDIRYTGNTVSSSLPIALKQAEKEGKLRRGMKIVLAGFGIGLSWGATVITY